MAVLVPHGTHDLKRNSLILVVDDDSSIREFLVLMLEEEGFATAEAANGWDALRVAARHPPSLVVSDIMMPLLNGYELVARLQKDEALRSVPIILITAAVLTRPVNVPLVRKPFDIDLLLAAIITSLKRPAMWEEHAAARV
jgi:CheY-like chemotaxis protein